MQRFYRDAAVSWDEFIGYGVGAERMKEQGPVKRPHALRSNGRTAAGSDMVQPGAAGCGRQLPALVKWFRPAKGYGFPEPVDGSAGIFCHLREVEDPERSCVPDLRRSEGGPVSTPGGAGRDWGRMEGSTRWTVDGFGICRYRRFRRLRMPAATEEPRSRVATGANNGATVQSICNALLIEGRGSLSRGLTSTSPGAAINCGLSLFSTVGALGVLHLRDRAGCVDWPPWRVLARGLLHGRILLERRESANDNGLRPGVPRLKHRIT